MPGTCSVLEPRAFEVYHLDFRDVLSDPAFCWEDKIKSVQNSPFLFPWSQHSTSLCGYCTHLNVWNEKGLQCVAVEEKPFLIRVQLVGFLLTVFMTCESLLTRQDCHFCHQCSLPVLVFFPVQSTQLWWSRARSTSVSVTSAAVGALALPAQRDVGGLLWLKSENGDWWGWRMLNWQVEAFQFICQFRLTVPGKMEKQSSVCC